MQSNEKMKAQILSYLSKQDTDYSILLSGAWGCGKTFFIDEFIKCAKENQLFLYLSLNGMTSVSDVLNSICLKLFCTSKLSNVIEKGKNVLLKNIDFIEGLSGKAKVAINFGNSVINYITNNRIKTLLEKNQNIVLFLDDLERISDSVDITDLLGVIHTSFIMKGVKVVYVADGDKLKERTDCKKFDKEKEKYIRRTIAFSSDKNAIFKEFLESYNIYTDNFLLVLQDVFSEEQVNLRSVKFCLDCYNELDNYYKTLSKDDYNSPEPLFYSVCRIGKFYQKGNYNKDELEEDLQTYFYNSHLNSSKDDEKTPCEKFAEKYGSKLVKKGFLFDLIYDGVFSDEDLKFYLAKPKYNEDPLFRLSNIVEMETSGLITVLNQVKNNLSNKQYSIRENAQLQGVFSDYAVKLNLATREELLNLIEDSIFDERNEKELNETFDYWLKDDFSRIKKAKNSFEEKLLSKFEDYLAKNNEDKINKFLDSIKSCNGEIFLDTLKYRDIYTALVKENSVDSLLSYPNKAIRFFATFISSAICNLGNANEWYVSEIPALKALKEKSLEKIKIVDKGDILRLQTLNDFGKVLDLAIKQIEK